MAKVRQVSNEPTMFLFACPGCKVDHYFDTKIWTFNGDYLKPTVRDSIRVGGTRMPTDDEAKRIMAGEKVGLRPTVCHSFITDGKIEFLLDSSHELAGQTVALPDYD